MNFFTIIKYFKIFLIILPIAVILLETILFFLNHKKDKKSNWKKPLIRISVILIFILGLFFISNSFFKDEPFYNDELIQDTSRAIRKIDRTKRMSENLIQNWNDELKMQEEKLLAVQNLKDLTRRQRTKVEQSLEAVQEKLNQLNISQSELILQKQIKADELKLLQEERLAKIKQKAELEKRFKKTVNNRKGKKKRV